MRPQPRENRGPLTFRSSPYGSALRGGQLKRLAILQRLLDRSRCDSQILNERARLGRRIEDMIDRVAIIFQLAEYEGCPLRIVRVDARSVHDQLRRQPSRRAFGSRVPRCEEEIRRC